MTRLSIRRPAALSSVPTVDKLQTGSQAAGQSIDGRLPSVTSLLFLELSGYYVNAVQLHVHAAAVLVRCGIHREGFR